MGVLSLHLLWVGHFEPRPVHRGLFLCPLPGRGAAC